MKHEGTRNQITERDKRAVAYLTRWGYLTTRQVADEIYSGSVAVAYRRLRVLQRHRLVARKSTLRGHPSVYVVTAQGARLANVGLRPARVGYAVLASLGHALAVADIAQQWQRQVPGITYETEREVRAAWHRSAVGGAVPFGRIPDLVVHPTADSAWAVEFDYTPKRSSQYRALLAAYLANPRYERVWWFTRSAAVCERVKAVATELGGGKRIAVRVWTKRGGQ